MQIAFLLIPSNTPANRADVLLHLNLSPSLFISKTFLEAIVSWLIRGMYPTCYQKNGASVYCLIVAPYPKETMKRGRTYRPRRLAKLTAQPQQLLQ